MKKYFEFSKKNLVIACCYGVFGALAVLFAFFSPAVFMYKKDALKMALTVLVTCFVLVCPKEEIAKIRRQAEEKKQGRLFLAFAGSIAVLLQGYLIYRSIWQLNQFTKVPSAAWAVANVLLISGFLLLLYGLIPKRWVAALVGQLFFYVWAIVDYYVLQFRGTVFLPWDFSGVHAAADVVGGYSFNIYKEQIFWALVLVLTVAAAARFFDGRIAGKTYLKKLCIMVIAGAALFASGMGIGNSLGLENNLIQTTHVYEDQGMVISFLHFCSFLKTPKPEGYSASKVQALTEEYAANTVGDAAQGDMDAAPDNIIVIMNESFTDFRTVGTLPEIDECLKNWDELRGHFVKGNLYVPVFGGNTVNTEYEVLTGNSLLYQGGGMPLTSKVSKDRPSLAWYMQQDLGYEVAGMHLGAANNWNRKSAYPHLGLKDAVFLDDVKDEDPAYFYHTVSDRWNYEKLIRMYEEKQGDRFFAFNVTIQNHGGYDDRTDLRTEDVVDLSAYGAYPMAETYLTCLRESDRAFKELLEYYSQVDEKTVIVMFGDHHPKVEESFYELLFDKKRDEWTKEDELARFATPYIIWTNYEDPTAVGDISANYLGEVILEQAHLPLTPYHVLLKQLREEYPVLSVNGVMDRDGTFKTPQSVENEPLVKNYRFFEYNSSSERKPYEKAFFGE